MHFKLQPTRQNSYGTITTWVMQGPLVMQNELSIPQNILCHLFLLDLRYKILAYGAVFFGKENELWEPIENPEQLQSCANPEMQL